MSKMVSGSIQLLIRCAPDEGIKSQERSIHHSPPYSVKIYNTRSFTSEPLILLKGVVTGYKFNLYTKNRM
jgi:hypothetical protein